MIRKGSTLRGFPWAATERGDLPRSTPGNSRRSCRSAEGFAYLRGHDIPNHRDMDDSADPYAATARKIGKTPVWVFHGGADDRVPVTESRQMVEALKAAGGNVRYTEYPGVKHDSWDKAYNEPELSHLAAGPEAVGGEISVLDLLRKQPAFPTYHRTL